MHTFHVIFYKFIRILILPWLKIKGFKGTGRVPQRSKANLILTNHNTNWDFFYFGASFREQMYFVASEHIFRLGFISKLIEFLVDPIPRKKGSSAISTTKEILKRLKKGYNVCMMAEGNRSFSGETGFISPNTAALARKSGAGLITYRLHGGYLVNPRWSKEVRKGPVWGEVTGQYTPEELSAMTDEQIAELINRDLYVDAFADQKEKHYKYKAKAPAEDLETALFACPDCGAFDCLESSGDKLVCRECGSTHIFNAEGSFERPDGTKPAFSNTLEWSNWQKDHLQEHISQLKDGQLVRTDEGAQLYYVHPLEGKQLAAEGRVSLYKDRLEFEDAGDPSKNKSFRIDDISSLAVILINTVLFTAGENYYELRLSRKSSALHYMISYYFLKGKEYKR